MKKIFLTRGPVFLLSKSWTIVKFIFLISESEKDVLNVINWCKMQMKIRNGAYLQVSKLHRFVYNSGHNVFLYIFHVQNSWSNCGRNNCLKNVIFICKAGGLIYLKIQLHSFAIRRCKVSDINPGIQSSVQRRTVKEAINDPVAIFCCLPVCSVLFHFLWGFFFFFSRDGLGMTFKALLVNISQLLAVKGWKLISLKVSC